MITFIIIVKLLQDGQNYYQVMKDKPRREIEQQTTITEFHESGDVDKQAKQEKKKKLKKGVEDRQTVNLLC